MKVTGNERPYLTIREAADKLAVSESTIRRLVADGSLPALRFRPRGVVRIPESALEPKETK